MKTIFLLCASVVAAAIAFFTFNAARRADHFGQPFTGLPPASIAEMVDKPGDFLGKPVRLRGVLKRQCPSSGCWFYLAEPSDPKAREIKIEMGDTTPRLPARLGKLATVEGQLIKFGEGYEFIGVAVTFEPVAQR
jgi:hypothetical protein